MYGWNGEREWDADVPTGCYVWRSGYDGSIVYRRTIERWVRIIKNDRRISIGEGSTGWNPLGMRPREIMFRDVAGDWSCGRLAAALNDGLGDGAREKTGDDERGNGVGSGHKRAG